MNTLNLGIPGLSIACRTWGNPDNPPILALHGWLDNANSFKPLAPYLAQNFYLIAADLPGHGHSSHLAEGCHYHFIDNVFVVTEIIKALNMDKVHLLGHSRGACIGSLVAGVIPDKIHSLALIEGLGPFSSPEETACSQLSAYAKNLLQQQDKKHRSFDNLSTAAMARAMKGQVSLEIAGILCERAVIQKAGRFYWTHDQRLLAPSPLRMTEKQILSCLEQITVKTCFIWSSDQFPLDSEMMKNRLQAVPDLQVIYLKGGHHIHMEQPEAISQLLAEFYSKL